MEKRGQVDKEKKEGNLSNPFVFNCFIALPDREFVKTELML